MMRSMGILSVCLSVGTFTFRIYSCSNSTITHAQNLCAIFFSHVVCTCSYVCVRHAQTCLFIFVSRRWGWGIRTAVCPCKIFLTRCVYVYIATRLSTCVCVGVRRVRGAWVAFENKNKPVSPPIVVTMCTAMLRLAP